MAQRGPQFHDIVISPEYRKAWRKMVEVPVSFREFSALPMPHGVTPEELWVHFAELRKPLGQVHAVKPWFQSSSEGVSWSFIPLSTHAQLRHIGQLASPQTPLNRSLDNPAIRLILSDIIIEELACACLLDGIDTDIQAIKKVISQTGSTKTPSEHAIVNTWSIINHPGVFVNRPLTVTLVERLNEVILHGTKGITVSPPIHRFSRPVEATKDDPFFAERMMRASLLAHKDDADDAKTAASYYMEIAAVLWDLDFFPLFNNLTELALRHIFFLQRKTPIMAYAPFQSRQYAEGSQYIKPFLDTIAILEKKKEPNPDVDCTLLFAETVNIIDQELTKLDNNVTRHIQSLHEQESYYQSIPDLNTRQKHLLTMMNRGEMQRITIRNYAELFNVVRATARADLFGLEEQGYLQSAMPDRTIVFTFVGQIPS